MEWLKFWPIAVVAAGAIASGAVDSYRLNAQAQEIDDIGESIDEIEGDISLIQRQLIERQGQVEVRTQRIEIEQTQQSRALERLEGAQNEILRLLREDRQQ